MTPDEGYWNHQMQDPINQVQQIAQPGAQPVIQPLPQQEVQPVAQPTVQEAVQSAVQQEAESAFQLEPQQAPEPEPQPELQLVPEPEPQPAPQPAPAPEPQSAPQQAPEPAPQQAAQFQPQPTPQPAVQSQPQPQFQSQSQPEPQQAAQPQPQPQRTPVWQPPADQAIGTAGYPQPSPAYASANQYYTQAPAQKKSHGWIVAIVVIVCLAALMAFGIKSCNDSMASFSDLSTTGDYGLSALEKDAIAVLVLDGTIQYDGTACSPEGFKELLDKADENDHVKALVLRVNSGGGTATAGEEMAEYLRQFTKPVVVSSASINASAAYEISSQADYIYVAKSTEIGSIGTAMELTDLSGLLDKLGIKMETITSADSKDSSYGYRGLSDDEREYYQNMINQINEMFIENVAEGRHMDIEDVRKLATGLVFTGVDATKNGLADAIGTREDAVKKAAELAGITDYTTTDLKFSSYDFSELAYLFGEDRSLNQYLLKLKDLLENAEQAGLL